MPVLPPDRTTELFYSGAWNNISSDMRDTASVTITRGVGAEGNRPAPMAATAVLDNRSGNYSPRNPHSALYELIGRNTPWRFSVEAGPARFTSTGVTGARMSTPPGSALTVVGDFDLRVDVSLTDWRRGHMLALRYRTTGESRSWAALIDTAGLLWLLWSPDGTFAARKSVSSTVPVPAYQGQRLALRFLLDINNGDGGHTVRFFYGSSVTGSQWTQLGAAVTGLGFTSVFDGTAPLEVADGTEFSSLPSGGALAALQGSVHGVRLLGGGAERVHLDFGSLAAAPGDTTFTDQTGLVWTLAGGATLSNRHTRMVGEVPAWPPSRDLSGNDRTVAITPAGIMRRLDAGNKPLASALQRFIVGSGHAVDCWPMTDGPQSQWANSLMGGNRLLPIGSSAIPIKWGKGDLGDWLEPVAAITKETSGTFRASIPRAAAAATGWSVDCVRAGDGVDTGMVVLDHGAGTTTDPQVRWTVVNQTEALPDTIRLLAQTIIDDNLTTYTLAVIGNSGLMDGRPHHLRLQTAASGGSSTTWSLYLDGVLLTGGTEAIPVHAPATVTYEWNEVFATVEVTDLSIGYLTVWDATGPDAEDTYSAYRGFIGEQAGARVLRVAAERGVPASMYGLEADGVRLGVQRPEKFLDTLNTVARTDLGYVLERRDALELLYRGRHTLYNQDPAITLDFAQGLVSAPFEPLDDDKLTQNEVTATRDGGTSTTAMLTSGRMSVQDPPAGVGNYDIARTLSLASDGQTHEHAYWRMHLGTYDGLRYTQVTVNLGNPRVYAFIDQIYRADVGDILRLTNLPADYGGGTTDLLIRGYKEEIGPSKWTITFTCDPGSPWTVGVLEDDVLGRADTDGSQLASSATASATTLSVAVTAGPLWITGAANQQPDPQFEEGTGAWACTRGATIGVVSWERSMVHSGTGALRITRVHPTDTGTMNISDLTTIRPAAAGQTWAGAAWVYSGGASANNMRVALAWRDTGGTETLIYGTAPSVTAGSWTQLTVSAVLPAGAVGVRLGVEGRSAWTVGEWWQCDDVRLARTDSLAGTDNPDQFPFDITLGGEVVRAHGISGTSSPQTISAYRGRNGITKAHAAATSLSLTHPMRAAL